MNKIVNSRYLILLFIFASSVFTSCLSDNDDPDLPELLSVAQSESSISLYVSAWDRTGFSPSISDPVNYTILAPNNSSMEAYLADLGYTSIDSVPITFLTNLVDYHIQYGYAPVDNIVSNYYGTPSGGGPGGAALVLFAEQLINGLFFNSSVQVVRADIKASNGVVHILGGVLEMPSAYNLLEQNASFSSSIEALERTGLDALLKNPNPYTFLAPTNQAFELYVATNADYDGIDDIPTDTLSMLLKYHLIEGNIPIDSLFAIELTPTLSAGDTIRIISDFDGSYSALGNRGSSQVLLGNIQGTNGILHAAEALLTP